MLVIHKVIKELHDQHFMSFSHPLLLQALATSHFACSFIVKLYGAGGHTQHHTDQIRGQPACHNPRPLLFLSSHFLILSIHPTRDLPPPPSFSTLHLLLCLPTPNLILSSLHNQQHPVFFPAHIFRKIICTENKERRQREDK